ncbi:MAG: hypothetical protein HQ567_31215 [Candidatus Nealsonbacteria bacterium]|nr:hypothetical protein [Candidatus Nealsonbacteria bacterium]
MSADPAELIFFQEMTTDKFFDEAEGLGYELDQLQDEDTHNHVFYTCLLKLRTATAKKVAEDLGIEITDEQAAAIGKNSLVPDVALDPAPLSPEERKIAELLYYSAIKAAIARHGSTIKERSARSEARRMVRNGEKGLTWSRKLSRASGCLVLVVLLTLGTGLSAAVVLAQ